MREDGRVNDWGALRGGSDTENSDTDGEAEAASGGEDGGTPGRKESSTRSRSSLAAAVRAGALLLLQGMALAAGRDKALCKAMQAQWRILMPTSVVGPACKRLARLALR